MDERTKTSQARTAKIGQHLLTTISYPHLIKYGKKEIRTFLKDRDQYLLTINDLKNSRSSIEQRSLKSSIDTELLEGFIFFQYFGAEVTSKE